MSKPFQISKTLPNPKGQAKLVATSAGLQYVKPRFFKTNDDQMAAEQAALEDGKNIFGLPFYDSLTIDELHYSTDDGKNIAVAKMVLENVIFVVTPTKNVIRTAIPGGKGTVKEFFGMGDYDIQITIDLVGKESNIPPELALRQLISFIEAPVPLSVYNNILSYFDIFSIVVVDQPSITQIKGARNGFNISIPCVSDIPFEVEFNQAKTPVEPTSGVASFVG